MYIEAVFFKIRNLLLDMERSTDFFRLNGFKDMSVEKQAHCTVEQLNHP